MRTGKSLNHLYVVAIALALTGCATAGLQGQPPGPRPHSKALRPCSSTGGEKCVEFTVRYHVNEQGSSYRSRIQVVEPNTNNALPPECRVANSPAGAPPMVCNHEDPAGTVVSGPEQMTLWLSRRNPDCFTICVGGWCYEECY